MAKTTGNFLFNTACISLLLILSTVVQSQYGHTAVQAQSTSLEEMWIDMRIGPPLIDLFNNMARPDDIARIEHPSQIVQLEAITGGRKMIVFKSISEAEEFLVQKRRGDRYPRLQSRKWANHTA